MKSETRFSNSPVVNWHVTEKCNYHCNYCFAKWGCQKEIWNNPEKVERIIDKISQYFFGRNYSKVRLNIVGGEPTLQPDLFWNLVKTAYHYDMEISLITNGSHLNYLMPFIDKIAWLGISIDSFEDEINKEIGRHLEQRFNFSMLEGFGALKKRNPDLKIKINTVVSEYNWTSRLYRGILSYSPDKWKILRQMPFGKKSGISDFKFYSFILNNCGKQSAEREYYDTSYLDDNENFVCNGGDSVEDLLWTPFNEHHFENFYNKCKVFIEDNDVMTESYLMISPDGRLFQNGGKDYQYSRPLTEVSFSDALSDIRFDVQKFNSRYNSDRTLQIIKDAKQYFSVYDWESEL